MTEIFEPPLYFAWNYSNGLPHVVHFYVQESARSWRTSLKAARRLREYFRDLGATYFYMNAMCADKRVQKAIEWFFKVKPYSEAEDHKFYLVEV
jgi:hypothetical protein